MLPLVSVFDTFICRVTESCLFWGSRLSCIRVPRLFLTLFIDNDGFVGFVNKVKHYQNFKLWYPIIYILHYLAINFVLLKCFITRYVLQYVSPVCTLLTYSWRQEANKGAGLEAYSCCLIRAVPAKFGYCVNWLLRYYYTLIEVEFGLR